MRSDLLKEVIAVIGVEEPWITDVEVRHTGKGFINMTVFTEHKDIELVGFIHPDEIMLLPA